MRWISTSRLVLTTALLSFLNPSICSQSSVYTGLINVGNMVESKAQTSYWRNGTSVSSGTRHVLALNVSVAEPYDSGSSWPSSDFWVGTQQPNPVSTVTGSPIIRAKGSMLYVTDPAGFGVSPAYALAPTSSTTSEAGLVYMVPNGNPVPVHVSSTGALSGASFKITYRFTQSTHTPTTYTYADTSTATFYDYKVVDSYTTAEFDVAKLSCTLDSSIDSRKIYQGPNDEGGVSGRGAIEDTDFWPYPAGFGSSIYKGGLFAGNMNWETGDLSRTARIQLNVSSGGSGTLLLATLSLLYKGAPSSANGSVDLGVFLPASNDPNLNVTEAETFWANKWVIAPRSTPGTPPDYSRDPVDKITFTTSTTANEYANWQLTDLGAAPPAMALSRLCVALHNEETLLQNSTTAWRYFCSKELAGTSGVQFPTSDGAPRVWRLGLLNSSTWTVNTP